VPHCKDDRRSARLLGTKHTALRIGFEGSLFVVRAVRRERSVLPAIPPPDHL
jgi:hypothetical protein